MEEFWTYLGQNWLEIFSLVTGIIFLVLEVMQKNVMWLVCIFSSAVCSIVFFSEKLYASMALNIYYVITAFWGLYVWIRDSRKMKSGEEDQGKIHLRKLNRKVALISLVCLAVFTPLLKDLLVWLGDSSSILDATALVLSIIGTIWLIQSYLEQWFVWIMADMISTAMCLSQRMYWMAALYAFYTLSAVYGYWHWKRNGIYVNK